MPQFGKIQGIKKDNEYCLIETKLEYFYWYKLLSFCVFSHRKTKSPLNLLASKFAKVYFTHIKKNRWHKTDEKREITEDKVFSSKMIWTACKTGPAGFFISIQIINATVWQNTRHEKRSWVLSQWNEIGILYWYKLLSFRVFSHCKTKSSQNLLVSKFVKVCITRNKEKRDLRKLNQRKKVFLKLKLNLEKKKFLDTFFIRNAFDVFKFILREMGWLVRSFSSRNFFRQKFVSIKYV